MDKHTIEKKLNDEYSLIGKISISDIIDESYIDIKNIGFNKTIMDKISPIENSEPIILSKYYNTYMLIDGYHRLKDAITKGKDKINAITLLEYNIKRYYDTLYDFLQKSIGKKIKIRTNNIIVVDSVEYYILENEGCGGCGNGWSSIKIQDKYIGKSFTINKIESKKIYNQWSDGSKTEDEDKYILVINNKEIAEVDTGWGNGYYGGDFELIPII